MELLAGHIGPTAASADVGLFARAIYLQSCFMPEKCERAVVVLISGYTEVLKSKRVLFFCKLSTIVMPSGMFIWPRLI